MKQHVFFLIFLSMQSAFLQCMETKTNDFSFTVSPARLILNNDTFIRPPFIPTTEEKYGIEFYRYSQITNNLKAIEFYCQSKITVKKIQEEAEEQVKEITKEAQGSKKPIAEVNKQINTVYSLAKEEEAKILLVSVPYEIQIIILTYCNIYPDDLYNPYLQNCDPFAFSFKGFLNEESRNAVQTPTFNLPEFSIQPTYTNAFNLKIDVHNDTHPFDPDKIVQTLKQYKLIPNNVDYWEFQIKNLREKIL